jgi:hypothetical protein
VQPSPDLGAEPGKHERTRWLPLRISLLAQSHSSLDYLTASRYRTTSCPASPNMDTQISQRASKALKDTVFHANIQIQSIENGSVGSSDAPKEELPSEHHTIDRQDAERAALMQSWWDEAIVRNMDLPDGYTDVAVLLIKWDDELDELKTGEEVTRTTPYICPAETDTRTGERARGYLQEPIPLRNADRRTQRIEQATASDKSPPERLHRKARWRE